MTTISPSRRSPSPLDFRRVTGRRIGRARRAEKKVRLNTNPAVTPIATMLPSSRSGGDSLRFRVRNPSAVVRLVIATAVRFSRTASTAAARRSSPWARC